MNFKTCIQTLLFIGFCFVSACDSDSGTTTTEPIDEGRTAFLKSIRSRVLLPLTEKFSQHAVTLHDAVSSHDLMQSKSAWRETLLIWQQLEMLQVGPAGVSGVRVGGADFRDHIYSSPITTPCRVEQEWLAQSFEDVDWIETAPYQVKGLDALELLLFKEGVMSSCPDQAQIVRDGSWMGFTEESIRYEEARWRYAEVISKDLKIRAATLAQMWSGDFGEVFEQASAPFSSQREAVDQTFAAIFYLDQVVKDFKLGAPTGVYMTCMEEICPELVEHGLSKVGREALIANFEGFLMVLRGDLNTDRTLMTVSNEMVGEDLPYGLRTLLIREGAVMLSEDLESLTLSAIEQLSTSNISFADQIATDVDSIRKVHNTVRSLTELLKTQVVTTLNLSVPREGAGDND